MKAYGEGCIDPRIIYLGTSWRWSTLRPGRCAPGIHWIGNKSCPYRDSNSDPSVVQPVARRYTDCAIPAP
jgi:hypothetical protein